jgi:hypothetical protein
MLNYNPWALPKEIKAKIRFTKGSLNGEWLTLGDNDRNIPKGTPSTN